MKNSRSQFALPARMTFLSEGLRDLHVQMLVFPFLAELEIFRENLKNALGEDKWRQVPWRRLSNLLLASSPSLAHGFEYYGNKASTFSGYYALCVSAPNAPFVPPATQVIATAIQVWLKDWLEPFYEKGVAIGELCERLLDSLQPLTDWNWQSVDVQKLIEHVDSYAPLSYNALPALLATLMHGTTTSLQQGDLVQQITWRRVQGDGSDRTGVFVVSCPFRAQYGDGDDEKTKEGYFAYRLDFRVQTQVGRLNANGELKPWIFLDVSCQRYGHESLLKNNFKRDVSVLVGTRQTRTPGFGISSISLPTLVRLMLHRTREKYVWEGSKYDFQASLARLLEEMQARPLLEPEELIKEPHFHGNWCNESTAVGDEYYLVHAEGLKYGEKGMGANHRVSTGFSFKERGEVVACVLEQLKSVLEPDNSLTADWPAPSGSTTPPAMRDFDFFESKIHISKEKRLKLEKSGELESHLTALRQKPQKIIHATLGQVLRGAPLQVLIVALDPNFRAEMQQALRDIWLLGPNDVWPQGVVVKEAKIEEEDVSLWDKLDDKGLYPADKKLNGILKAQEPAIRRRWEEFLKEQFRGLPPIGHRCALIALTELSSKELHLSIKGAVRAACANQNVASQMVISKASKGALQHDFVKAKQDTERKGRLQNAGLDLVMRQIGGLYGEPTKIYSKAGLEKVAGSLDIVALCRYQSNNPKVQYALAVRLSPEGTIDVLLPGETNWISYHNAGPRLGRIFIEGRKLNWKKEPSPVVMGKDAMAEFAAHVFASLRARPTLAVIDADGWRNREVWPQLQNGNLGRQRDVLNFQYAPGSPRYNRQHHLPDLIGVVRIRDDAETPQYIPRAEWDEDTPMRDFGTLSGFIDSTVPEIPHYFSAARLPDTQKGRLGKQDNKRTRDIYKLDLSPDPKKPQFVDYGAKIAFKHPQFIEMLPFFVHDDFAHDQGMSLCRALHYLRISPAWSMGNILSPYPMHLGYKIVEDHCCILREE